MSPGQDPPTAATRRRAGATLPPAAPDASAAALKLRVRMLEGLLAQAEARAMAAEAALERAVAGRRKGPAASASSRQMVAAIRHQVLENAIADLFRHADTSQWPNHRIAQFIYDRQSEIGIRRQYTRATIAEKVKHIARKHREIARNRSMATATPDRERTGH